MTIQLSLDGAIAHVTLCNEKTHNALGCDDINAFLQHLETVQSQPDIRVLIISNSGGSTFCSGASIRDFSNGTMSGELFSTLTNTVAEFGIPTIAAINGNAYGGGSELALCCDFRFGSSGMRLFVPPARLGLCYPLDGMKHFIHRLGLNTTKRLLLAAEEFNGQQLNELGYLTHLTAPGLINIKAQQLAAQISTLAPIAVRTMKQLCNQISAGDINTEQAQQAIDQCNNSADLQEGLSAAREKRSPQFKGL